MRCLTFMVFSVVCAAAAQAQEPEPAAGTSTAASTAVLTPAPESSLRPRRLQFRDGPACMCPQGLSEADIAAATASREAKALPPTAPSEPARAAESAP